MRKSEANNVRKGEAGFGLIESVFAMLIFVIGTLAVLGLIAEATRIQVNARSTTEATAAARRQMERILARPKPQRVVGGNLNANVTSYNESIAVGTDTTRYISRWQIEERDLLVPATLDIPAGMQRITVRLEATRPGLLLNPITIRTMIR